MKRCYKCKDDKNNKDFAKNKRYKDGLNDICKSCKKEQGILNKSKRKLYEEKTKDRRAEYAKEYALKNKDKIKEYTKNYYKDPIKRKLKNDYVKNYDKDPKNKENKKQYLKKWFDNNPNYLNEYANKKYKEDIYFKLKNNLRSRFYHFVKGNSKTSSVLKLLGCSLEEYKKHIESLFKPEMNWENHGIMWEADHIKSCSSFNLNNIEEQKLCFHYTNMQPLFKTTEIAKSFGYIDQIGNRNKNKY